MDVSENSDTPKSSISIGFYIKKPSIFGYPYLLETPSPCGNITITVTGLQSFCPCYQLVGAPQFKVFFRKSQEFTMKSFPKNQEGNDMWMAWDGHQFFPELFVWK